MRDTVIEVDSLWKKYRLGVLGTGTLRHDLNRWWHRVRGKPDPYEKIGDRSSKIGTRSPTSDLRSAGQAQSPNSAPPSTSSSAPTDLADDEIWALRDVSFEVKQGEILGIIGRNGAGKSTLLKILSRVTAPTHGEVRVKGRIASLLEVGTGFHPELTGRENIFLNGAILGMTKTEIRSKLDEIIAFAEVEQFIDTPVKRYSSGMYVRLAFAVAAHLEPEILIVDEVLAVGDSQFQKKCLGKMNQVSKTGRTVLFVSHNMNTMGALCSRCVHLRGGEIRRMGMTAQVISEYLEEVLPPQVCRRQLQNDPRPAGVGVKIRMLSAEILVQNGGLRFNDPLSVVMEARAERDLENVFLGISVDTVTGATLFTAEADVTPVARLHAGQTARVKVTIPSPALPPGKYVLVVGANAGLDLALDYVSEALVFEVVPRPEELMYAQRPYMGLRPGASWEVLSAGN